MYRPGQHPGGSGGYLLGTRNRAANLSFDDDHCPRTDRRPHNENDDEYDIA